MLSFVPTAFDTYRPLKQRHRWAMQCLVSFADHAGRCFPSLRTFAVHAAISKSAAGRDLAECEAEGYLTRTRRQGGVYVYQIAKRFLPQWTREQVSQARDRKREAWRARRADRVARGVPEPGTEEKPEKKNQGYAQARVSYTVAEEPWRQRVRAFFGSRFWLPKWGPSPGETGCLAPLPLIKEVLNDAARTRR
jgi:DNA-binding transcriptional regulator YhcF (GntR family)